MSIEALNWAMNHAPIPPDANGARSAPCTAVLIGLANHAGPDGRHAFPSVARLVRYTSLSERTVRSCLDRLVQFGTISYGSEQVVAAHIARPQYRPRGYDLNLGFLDTSRGAPAAPLDDDPNLRGAGGAPLGVQPAQSRGAGAAPEPSLEPPLQPTEAPADADAPGLFVVEGGHQTDKQRAADAAQLITSQWWETFTPRPTANYLGQRKIVQRLLEASWDPRQIEGALRGCTPPLTLALMERRLRHPSAGAAIVPAHDWKDGESWGTR